MRSYKCTAVFLAAWVCITTAEMAGATQPTSEAEYRDAAIALFKDFMLMEQDGVFWSYESVDLWEKGYLDVPNVIRGEHKPGGWFGRPPGSEWLKRLDALMDSWPRGLCLEIPPLPSHAANGWPGEICLQQISMLWSAPDEGSRFALDGLAAQFWLATICHESPQVCEPYLPGSETDYLFPASMGRGG